MASRVLMVWNPEDKEFWEREGKAIAARNLWISIPALFLAFAVWMVWSVVVVNLPTIGFQFDADRLFWLAALPGLAGATLRIFYSFMVPIFGGRKWTTLSTASLLIPAVGIGFAVRDLEHELHDLPDPVSPLRPGGRELRLQHVEHQLFLPQVPERDRTRTERGAGKPRGQRHAVPRAARHYRRGVRRPLRRPAELRRQRCGEADVAAECRVHLGAVHRRLDIGGMVRHERHRQRQGVVQ